MILRPFITDNCEIIVRSLGIFSNKVTQTVMLPTCVLKKLISDISRGTGCQYRCSLFSSVFSDG
jgi:hypothetical protein